jgi:hypothetical protein
MAMELEHSGHVKQITTSNLHLQLGILELPVNLQSNQKSQRVQLSRKMIVL